MSITEPSVLTNRGHSHPDSGIGFDTIAVAGPTDAAVLQELQRVWQNRSVDRDSGLFIESTPFGKAWLPVGQAQATVIVSLDHAGGHTMRLEVSAPQMLLGHNWDGLPMSQMDTTLAALLAAVDDDLPYVPAMHQIRVCRLDLTRDFLDVRDPSATLDVIAKHASPRATVDRQHRDPRSGRLLTLERGNANYWHSRAYDKFAEQASRGRSLAVAATLPDPRSSQLRFEVQLKSRELRRQGLTSPAAIADTDMTELARLYFERGNYHVNTGQQCGADVMTLMELEGVSKAEQRALLAYLQAEQFGGEPPMSHNLVTTARRLARQYGHIPGSLARKACGRRLDFELGREVSH